YRVARALAVNIVFTLAFAARDQSRIESRAILVGELQREFGAAVLRDSKAKPHSSPEKRQRSVVQLPDLDRRAPWLQIERVDDPMGGSAEADLNLRLGLLRHARLPAGRLGTGGRSYEDESRCRDCAAHVRSRAAVPLPPVEAQRPVDRSGSRLPRWRRTARLSYKPAICRAQGFRTIGRTRSKARRTCLPSARRCAGRPFRSRFRAAPRDPHPRQRTGRRALRCPVPRPE